jgi:imidazole glycerol-phosphate synthase subunit HisH
MVLSVDIIDLGIGNTVSIKKWFDALGIQSRLIHNPSELNAEVLILPGVGAVKEFMSRIKEKKFDEAIKIHVNNGGRLIGICLGFQVLFESSAENGGVKTLGLWSGQVEKLQNKINHNGWCEFELSSKDFPPCWRTEKMTRARHIKGRMFFNHEYGVVSNLEADVALLISEQLSKYKGLIIKDNVMGIQFHPEKSQQTGSQFLKFVI